MARLPELPAAVPRRRNRLLRAVGHAGLTALNWRVEGNLPDEPKMVVVVAPHTSNWDLPIALFAALALELDAKWFAKHTIFRGPFSAILRALGGIPIVRSTRQRVTDQWIAEINGRDGIVLGIAPEGTRRKVTEWRTGFWYLARGARVPIVPAALDYRTKSVVVGDVFWPTDDIGQDMAALRGFFARVTPKRPGLY